MELDIVSCVACSFYDAKNKSEQHTNLLSYEAYRKTEL